MGDFVRVTYLTHVFTRDVDEKWSGEVFKVVKRFRREGIPLYKLQDFFDEAIKGTFYAQELQKVAINEEQMWKIEKVLKTRKRRGKKEYFVRWKHWPKKFDSWVKDVHSLKV